MLAPAPHFSGEFAAWTMSVSKLSPEGEKQTRSNSGSVAARAQMRAGDGRRFQPEIGNQRYHWAIGFILVMVMTAWRIGRLKLAQRRRHEGVSIKTALSALRSPRIEHVRGTAVYMMEDSTLAPRSFLHNQVRSMVGSLRLVGEGKWTPRDMKHALDAADRTACGPVAPPDGLYLVRVDYE